MVHDAPSFANNEKKQANVDVGSPFGDSSWAVSLCVLCALCGRRLFLVQDRVRRHIFAFEILQARAATGGDVTPGCTFGLRLSGVGSTIASIMPEVFRLPAEAGDWFPVADGLPHPDWQAIRHWRKQSGLPQKVHPLFWQAVINVWLRTLGDALGPDYSVQAGGRFVLLSALTLDQAYDFLDMLERMSDYIEETLGDIHWADAGWTRVVILLENHDHYYTYISHYYPDGVHGQSCGVCLHTGYVHLAVQQYPRQADYFAILPHELTHRALAHLELPAWIGEGLAQVMEDAWSPPYRMPGQTEYEMARIHGRLWRPSTIQFFWRGESFHRAGRCQHASYELAKMLVGGLIKHKKFKQFVLDADRRDAGQASAQAHLKTTLGKAMQNILGRRQDWEPGTPAVRQ